MVARRCVKPKKVALIPVSQLTIVVNVNQRATWIICAKPACRHNGSLRTRFGGGEGKYHADLISHDQLSTQICLHVSNDLHLGVGGRL